MRNRVTYFNRLVVERTGASPSLAKGNDRDALIEQSHKQSSYEFASSNAILYAILNTVNAISELEPTKYASLFSLIPSLISLFHCP